MQKWLNKPLVVATTDIQAYYCLVNLLKKAGFSDFMSLLPESELPPNTIILTTKVEGKKIARRKEGNFRVISFNFNGRDKTVEDLDLIVKILEQEKGKKVFEKSVIGIDPGSKYTGLALLVEDQVVYTCRRQGIEEVEKTLSKILRLVKARRRVVKLGEGWGREAKKWIEHFKNFVKRKKNVEFYVVPEHGTTKKKSKNFGKDQAAAIQIAYRPENFERDG